MSSKSFIARVLFTKWYSIFCKDQGDRNITVNDMFAAYSEALGMVATNKVWIPVKEGLPEKNYTTLYLVKCPDWNASGYQVCRFRKGKFEYEEQLNDDFNKYVTEWTVLEEESEDDEA